MRFKGTGAFTQNMGASSSIFSPESWTLLPRREWLQDSALKHQTFRSLRVYTQCDLSCTKGWLHWEQLLWQLPRPGKSTDAVNPVPAPCLWCWQQSQTTKPTQFHTWLGPLTWPLFPARFFAFLKQCGCTTEHQSDKLEGQRKTWVQLQKELLWPMQQPLYKGQTNHTSKRAEARNSSTDLKYNKNEYITVTNSLLSTLQKTPQTSRPWVGDREVH